MKTIFLALQHPLSRSWFPVARVDREEDVYLFRYTKGARHFSEFPGFGRMSKLDAVYYSHDLFPLLKNRVIARNRGDFSAFARWLGKEASQLTFFDELAVTGGLRGTDSIELIPVPEITPEGMYEVSFFVHGVRYLPERAQEEFSTLRKGDELVLVPEYNNESDRHALLLKKNGSSYHVGYVPRYFSKEFSGLLESGQKDVRVTVSRVNSDAPLAFKVLCELVTPWPSNFDSCRGEDFDPMTGPPSQIEVFS